VSTQRRHRCRRPDPVWPEGWACLRQRQHGRDQYDRRVRPACGRHADPQPGSPFPGQCRNRHGAGRV